MYTFCPGWYVHPPPMYPSAPIVNGENSCVHHGRWHLTVRFKAPEESP